MNRKLTIVKKIGGDDDYSWCVVSKRTGRVILSGLHKSEKKYWSEKIDEYLREDRESEFKLSDIHGFNYHGLDKTPPKGR